MRQGLARSVGFFFTLVFVLYNTLIMFLFHESVNLELKKILMFIESAVFFQLAHKIFFMKGPRNCHHVVGFYSYKLKEKERTDTSEQHFRQDIFTLWKGVVVTRSMYRYYQRQ